MIVAITFADASEEKIIHNAENVYTKGKMLVVRQQDWLWKYPLMNVSMVRRTIDGDHEYIATKEANIEVRVIPLHSAAEKIFTNAQDVGTKGDMIYIQRGDWMYGFPLCNVFSVCHKHGAHWGSRAMKKQNNIEE